VKLAKIKTNSVVRQIEVVNKEVRELEGNVILLIGAAVSMALGIGFFVSRSIAVPIMKLKYAVEETGKGKVDKRVNIKSIR
jgi:signal transduction histidine kinase